MSEKPLLVDFAGAKDFVEIGVNYLELKADVPLELLPRICDQIKRMAGAVQWIIGDFFAQVDKVRGNAVAQRFMSEWDISYASATRCKRVCESFPRALRRADLSFSHHEAALTLGMDIQESVSLLHSAAQKNLSVSGMRRDYQVKEPSVRGRGSSDFGAYYGFAQFCVKTPVEKLDPSTRQQLKQDAPCLIEWLQSL